VFLHLGLFIEGIWLQEGRVVGIDGEWRPAVARLHGSRCVDLKLLSFSL